MMSICNPSSPRRVIEETRLPVWSMFRFHAGLFPGVNLFELPALQPQIRDPRIQYDPMPFGQSEEMKKQIEHAGDQDLQSDLPISQDEVT